MVVFYWCLEFILFFSFGGSFLLGMGVVFTGREIETLDLVALIWLVLSSPGVRRASTGRISCTSASPFWLGTWPVGGFLSGAHASSAKSFPDWCPLLRSFLSSYSGLMISVVPICSLGVDWESFDPSLPLAGLVLWASRISLFVGPSLCLTGVLLRETSKITVLGGVCFETKRIIVLACI